MFQMNGECEESQTGTSVICGRLHPSRFIGNYKAWIFPNVIFAHAVELLPADAHHEQNINLLFTLFFLDFFMLDIYWYSMWTVLVSHIKDEKINIFRWFFNIILTLLHEHQFFNLLIIMLYNLCKTWDIICQQWQNTKIYILFSATP